MPSVYAVLASKHHCRPAVYVTMLVSRAITNAIFESQHNYYLKFFSNSLRSPNDCLIVCDLCMSSADCVHQMTACLITLFVIYVCLALIVFCTFSLDQSASVRRKSARLLFFVTSVRRKCTRAIH